MKKYAIGILSFFENQNKVYVIEATNEVEAMKLALVKFCKTDDAKKSQEEWQQNWSSVEEIINECFNSEIGISEPVLIE